MKIARAIIESGKDTPAFTGTHIRFYYIRFVSAVPDIVVGILGGPQAETRGMFGRQHGIFYSGIPRNLDPLIHIKLGAYVEMGILPLQHFRPKYVHIPKQMNIP